jgi:hypothetical protein
MKSKLFTTFAAIAIAIVATSTSFAGKVYTPAQFTTALKEKVGTKTGASAYNAAAGLFKSALGEPKNKKNADKYAKSIVKLLKPKDMAKDPVRGKGVNTLVKSLMIGYFKKLTFNLEDARYNKALLTLIKSLPTSQKTTAVSQMIYSTVKGYAISKGPTQEQIYSYFSGVAVQGNLPPPPVS